MKKLLRLVFAAMFLVTANFIIAQNNNVGIGTTTPKESAKLDVESTTQGFLPPRMTEAQRDAMPVLPATTLEAGLVIWCTNCGSNGEMQVYNGSTWTNMIGGPAASVPPPLAIGDMHAGGIIFYLDTTGQHGLVCAMVDQSAGIAWTTSAYQGIPVAAPGARSDSDGVANTNAIVAQTGLSPANTYAAGLCRLYSTPGDGGLFDWYLPSAGELNLMRSNVGQAAAAPNTNIANFSDDLYWSSTEVGPPFNSSFWDRAFVIRFSTGFQSQRSKGDSTLRVRAIRAF